MKMNALFTTSCAAMGLSALAFAGSEEVVEAKPQCDGHNPWTVEASLLYLKSEGDLGSANYQNQSHETGYEIMLGYQPCPDSWAYSLTYTDYEGTIFPAGSLLESGPDITMYEFAMSKAFQGIQGWNSSYSFGVRYVEWEEPFFGGLDVDYTGFGPVFGVSATYDLPSNFSLFADVELGVLFGDDDQGGADETNVTYGAGVGVRYDIDAWYLDGSYVKLGYEIQQYSGLGNNESDVTTSGVILSLGYQF